MEKQIFFKNTQISYSINGKGSSIVLLHGFLENSKMWTKTIKELSQKYKTIAIDLPGHGKSNCIGYVHSMELMADCVYEVIKNERVKKPILVGHSMGGYVALAFADLYPDNTKGICLYNSTAQADSKKKVSDRNRAIEVVKKNKNLFINEAIPNLFVNKENSKIKRAILKAKKLANSCDKQGVIAALEGMKVRVNRELLLRFTNHKYFFIIGKNDPIIPYQSLLEQTKIPEFSSYYLSETGGHMCFIEDELRCLTELKKFISSCN